MTDFNGRTILVTGASGGIGGATVRQLVDANADVIASGRSQTALDALAQETGCRTLAFELTEEEAVRDALEGLDLWGVVNCGGFGGEIATPMDTDISVFDKVIADQRPRRASCDEVRIAVDDPARQGRLDRQRLEPSVAGGAERAYFLRLVQGRARQHHSRLGARARQVQRPGEQREPDRRS